MTRRQPRSTLFPSPTLFRSNVADLFEPHSSRAHPRVLRRSNRPALAFGNLGRKYLLTPRPLEHLEVFAAELDPGGSTGDEPYTDRKSTRLNSSHGYISYAVF